MRFAMQAAGGGGAANVQLAMLTAHNVIRVLARPEQWAPGYDPQDPMKPIFEDLSGVPAVGGQSLRTYLKERHGMGGNPKDANAIGYSFFESGGNVQIFRAMNGVGSSDQRGLANGGSHYYFWLGTVGQAIAGDLIAAGIKSEKDVKSALGAASGSVGAIQARNAQVGRALARCLEKGVVNGLPGGTPPSNQGSTGGLFKGLGEVNKAIADCEMQDAVTAAKNVDAIPSMAAAARARRASYTTSHRTRTRSCARSRVSRRAAARRCTSPPVSRSSMRRSSGAERVEWSS